MSKKSSNEHLKRISSAAGNMSALVDDIVKKARKNFKNTGKAEVDAKFLKESVGALRELYGLLGEYEDIGGGSDGIVVRFEKELEDWNK